jgi:fructuronate reductase
VLAAWVSHLRGHGAPVTDARADEVLPLVAGTPAESVDRVLGYLAPDLADHDALRAAVLEQVQALTRPA